MKIAEIFYSIQGEGTLTGVPSVFVRTSGCNLRCVWCDTPYTSWTPEGEQQSIDQIVDQVRSHRTARHVVVTGGEPMIAPEIVTLTKRLRELGSHITIETAGTVFVPVECDLMSISPKLANSTPEGVFANQHERLRTNTDVLKQLIQYPHQLKFVVSSPADLEEVEQLLQSIGADRANVLLMPEGRTEQALHERSLWLAEVCKETGYRFCQRLHVNLWGDRRGV